MAARGRFWIGGPAARAGWRLLQFLHRIGRFFFHGVRVNWKQKHLSDWFIFEITFLLWRWRHKIQNTHAINFQTRASLDWSEIFAAVKWRRRKKAQGKKIPILFNPCFSHDQNFNEVDDDTCDNCSSFLISFGESADVFEKNFKGKKFKNFIILVNSEVFFWLK